MNNPFKQVANNYTNRNWPVIPVHQMQSGKCSCGDESCSSPGKHPIPANGCNEGTTDERRIGMWERSNPDANIGICTGASAGIFVLDVDVKGGGPATLANLEEERGKLPQTVTANTGGGGTHFFFRYPDRRVSSRANVHPGLDVRGDGGYVVAAPSTHLSGKAYEWRPNLGPYDCELADAPEWLLDIVAPPKKSPPRKANQQSHPPSRNDTSHAQVRLARYLEKCPAVEEGGRNDACFKIALRLREITDETEYQLTTHELSDLLQSWNASNTPPMDNAEVQKIAESAMKHQLNGPRSLVDDNDSHRPAETETDVAANSGLLPPFKRFPVHLLPEPVGAYVQAAAEAIGCDPCYIAMPMIAAIGAAIGNTRRIRLKGMWSEAPIFWTVLVGESGTSKTPAMNAAIGELENLQRAAHDRFQEQLQEHKKAKHLFKVRYDEWKRKAKKGELTDNLLPPTEPEPPIMVRYFCSDATIEALAALLQNQPRGLLLKRDELAGWFGDFGRYSQGKGADVAQWLEMFNAGTVTIDRKTGIPPTLYIPNAAVCITGGIQPGILKEALEPKYRDNGLAARMLYAYPPPLRKRWTEAEVPPELSLEMSTLFQRLYDLGFSEDKDAKPAPKHLPLSKDAKPEWVEFYNQHNETQVELAGDLAAMWSKLEGYAARFALLVHLIRWAARDQTLEGQDMIDRESVRAGVALSRWFGYEGRRVYQMLSLGEAEQERQRLVDWICKKGGSATSREVQQGHRKLKSSGLADEALQGLVDAGLGVWEYQPPSPGGGRPTQKFVLTAPPAADENTADPVEEASDDDEWGEA